MHWGITVFFADRREFEVIAEIAPKYPVEFIEIRGEQPFFAPEVLTETDLDFFRDIIARAGVRVTLHSTFYDINLATINSFLREATLNCYRKYLDLAAAVGAENMVLHGGLLHKDAAGLEQLRQLARNNLVENLKILGDVAAEKGVKVGLENSPPNRNLLMVPGWRQQIDILEEVNHPAVGAVYDMAHAHLHGWDLREYLAQIEPYLIEIHAHNNHGTEDEHAGMTRGEIDYQSIFREHPVAVPVIMEIRNMDEALESLEWIKRF